MSNQKIGIVWTENANMTSFCSVMKACEQVITRKHCDHLYLIRAASVGHLKLKGNQIYRHIFNNSSHYHIKASLNDIHYLATYHQLVNSAKGNELLVLDKVITLEQLESLIRESGVVSQCLLLQNLGIIRNPIIKAEKLKPAVAQ